MYRSLPRRKVLFSLLAVSAAGPLLAACGKDEDEQAAAPEKPAEPGTSNAKAPPSQGTVDMDKLLSDEALPDKALGDANAPVTIVEYASMTCPHCARFHEETFPDLKKKYIDTGKVRFIFREFPFDPRAEAGFMLARCSDDKYFAMVNVLFKQQRTWATAKDGKDALLQIAKLAGFSQESFEACLTDQKLLDDIRSVKNRGANEFGVDATPTFFINGKKYAGEMTIDEVSAIIDPLLA